MKYFKKIVGNRLYLSPICAEDAEFYLKWFNDKTVAENYGQYTSVLSSSNDLKWLFEPPQKMQRYAMVLLEGDVLLGSISLHDINHFARNAFIGIFIGEAEYRGKGYGAEAIQLILNYGFQTMNLHNIALTVHADNEQGIACYKKVGFKEVGRRRDWGFKNGKYVDVVCMDILESEFRSQV